MKECSITCKQKLTSIVYGNYRMSKNEQQVKFAHNENASVTFQGQQNDLNMKMEQIQIINS